MININDMAVKWKGLSDGEKEELRTIAQNMDRLSEIIHSDNEKWWTDLETGEPIDRSEPEMIALAHSELSEALEAIRKNLKDEKLPSRPGVEVELADAIIRILDHGAGKGYDISGALIEKMLYNRHREDHKVENRKKDDGKKF